ncbi:MAG: hypothetical protein RR865_02955 [Clostridia bacterium]
MSFTEEFTQQWNGLTNYLISEMIKSNDTKNAIVLQDIQRTLDNEKKRWKMPGQYHCAWLEKLRAEKPEVAEAFSNELNSFKLAQVKPADGSMSIGSAAITFGPAIGGAAIGFGIGKLFKFTDPITVIATLGLGMLGVVMSANLQKRKRYDSVSHDCDQYKLQLNTELEKLLEIVKKADS